MGKHSDRFRSGYATLAGEDLIGEKINGKSAEGEDRGVEREAQANHQPIGRIEAKYPSEFQLVDCASLSQVVAFFRTCLEDPVDDRSYYTQHARADRDQQWTPSA